MRTGWQWSDRCHSPGFGILVLEGCMVVTFVLNFVLYCKIRLLIVEYHFLPDWNVYSAGVANIAFFRFSSVARVFVPMDVMDKSPSFC